MRRPLSIGTVVVCGAEPFLSPLLGYLKIRSIG
jgi:hypothetical protein